MAVGKAIVDYVHTKGVEVSDVVSWEFIYRTSTVRDSRWNIGDRVALPDGRVFRYAKSGGALVVDRACDFVEDEAHTYTTIKTAAVVGATEVEITGSAHAIFTEDELRGGYVIIYHTGGGGDSQFRGIIGNPGSALNADFTIKLDGGLDHAVIAASTGVEVFYNPYSNLQQVGPCQYSKAGKPAAQVDATATYFWVQTWGPCWLSPQLTSFGDNNDRGAWFRHDGSIEGEIIASSKDVNLNSTQYAGFLIGEGLSSGPLFMLQVSP